MRTSLVGGGYVGLVTGACLADSGHDVVVADIDSSRVEQINAGRSPIFEAGLADLIGRNIGVRFRATTDIGQAVAGSELTLIAVGTPSSEDGVDLSAIVAASKAVGHAVAKKGEYHAVVVKSTVVPGTTDGVVTRTLEESSGRRAGEHLGIGMNPEFLTEGRAVADFRDPDRLILGANDSKTHSMLQALYESFAPSAPRLLTSTRTAEMIKYTSNALLATMISFANEVGDFCATVGGVDVVDVMQGVHASDYLSPRSVGDGRVKAPIAAFLEAGCGFGGSCLPKDLRALIAEGKRRDLDLPLLRAALETNEKRPAEVVRLLESAAGSVHQRRVTILGVAFKPETDDVRESPAIPIAEALVAAGAIVTAHDPVVRVLPRRLRALGIELEPSLVAALEDAEAVVLITSWDDYGELPRLLDGREPAPVVLDGRRVLEPSSIARYAGIGRG